MTDLPRHWTRTKIVELLELNNNGKPFQQGWSPRCETFPASSGEWGVLKTTAIQEGEFWGHENKALPGHLSPRPHLEVKRGDLLITCAGPRSRCGVICLVDRAPSRLMMSGKMYRFRPRPEMLDPKYLAYFIQTREAQLAIDRMKTGISDSGLNLTHDRFATLQVAVAPINEQHRIVAKLDELLSELDNGIESLRTAHARLELYRHALLKEAFEGKLTADWRDEHGLTSPQSTSRRNSGPEHLPGLPRGWSYRALGDLLRERPHYGTSKKCDYEFEGKGVLRIPNIASGVIDPSDLKGAEFTEDEASKYALERGDILVIRSNGSVSLVGKPALVSARDEQYLFAGYLIRLRCDLAALRPEYLALALSSHALRTQIGAAAKSTSGVHNINARELQSLLLPACSVEEQDVIVQRLDSRLSGLETLATEIDTEIRRTRTLRQAVLRRAFTGQLVAHDSEDEPASLLLERIQAECDLESNSSKKRKARS